MTSREIVRRNVEFHSPGRIAIDGEDIAIVAVKPAGSSMITDSLRDEWGCVWRRTERVNMGQVVEHPLDTWEKVRHYPFPNPDEPSRYAHMEEEIRKAERGGKYIAAVPSPWFILFERMHMMRGFENLLTDFYVEPDRVHELAERLLQFQLGIIANLKKRFYGSIDCYFVSTDWGTQQGLIVGLPLWQEFFKERYRRLIAAIHEAGMHAFLHSCGKINNIIQEYIDIGLDIINPLQPLALGIDEIAARYTGKICFATCVDVQRTLPAGTEEEITREAEYLVQRWSTPEGGFIALVKAVALAGIEIDDQRLALAMNAFKRIGCRQETISRSSADGVDCGRNARQA